MGRRPRATIAGMDDENKERWLRGLKQQLERQLGRPLTADEREEFSRLGDIERMKEKVERTFEIERQLQAPMVAFMRKLMARQGTVMPDFDSLYRRKAELDRDRSP